MLSVRENRGLDIATRCKGIKHVDDDWIVPSQSCAKKYVITKSGDLEYCTCPDHELTGEPCKHIFAIRFLLKPTLPIVKEAKPAKPTYTQNWPAYNTAQTNEKHKLQVLLHDMCGTIKEPVHVGRGRRPIPLSDAIFSAVFKVYSTVSGRRFISDLKDSQEAGYIDQLPHYNSIFNCLESEDTTPILQYLITQSSLPLKSLEQNFAADSSGFSSSRFDRWFDEKYGREKKKHQWVKVHIMCGVKTNVVTAAEVGEKYSNDNPFMPILFQRTAKHFTPKEVAADMGYLSASNLNMIVANDATPFIPFKSNSKAHNDGSLWDEMFHYYSLHRADFLERYHQRSNVESTFSMIKAKFGDSVRSRTDVAMKNEVLCKIVCHNICCVIQSMYELGIDPVLWQGFEGKKLAGAG